jgi:hypothetical protein
MKLLILTDQRWGEITLLKGSMVGGDIITLPGSLCKNRWARTFPLGSMARSMRGPRPALDAYFFRARGRTTPFDGFSKRKPCSTAVTKSAPGRYTIYAGLSRLGSRRWAFLYTHPGRLSLLSSTNP